MYQFRNQGVKSPAKEIDLIYRNVQTSRDPCIQEGIWRDCINVYTRLREAAAEEIDFSAMD